MENEKFRMKCDLCGTEYEYSEDIIHHYTLIYDGKLRPHTHVCIECEKEYNLTPTVIKPKGEGTKTNSDAALYILNEGIGYAVQKYISGDEFKDPLTRKLWNNACNALNLLEDYLRDEINSRDY